MTDFRAPIDQSKQTPEQKTETVVSPIVEPAKVVTSTTVVNPVVTPTPVNAPVQNTEIKEWPLDRVIKSLVHFIAQMIWQPDPITGEKSAPTIPGNVAQKVRDTANKAIEKVGDVAQKTVDITGSVVNKVGDVTQKAVETTTSAVNAVKDIKQDIMWTNQPATQSLESLGKPE